MLSVGEARELLLANIRVCETEEIFTGEALGRFLVSDIAAPGNYPPFDYSSMDGFAVNSFDLNHCSKLSPVELDVVDDIPAGKVSSILIKRGEAARIMTGSMLPAGADAVVPVEWTDINWRDSDQSNIPVRVKIFSSVQAGEFVRKTGEDFSQGQVVIPKKALRAQEIGFLAMLGIPRLVVYKKPRVGILASGDELTRVGMPLAPGKIYDSNSLTISSLISRYGAISENFGIAGDDLGEVTRLLDLAVDAHVDLIISTAGVSVGAFDFIKTAIQKGGTLSFWQVNMRPGKPIAFGNYNGIPFIGLPGNPVSAFVGCEVFVFPAIRKMSGAVDFTRNIIQVVTTEAISSDGRESYLRAIVQNHGGKWLAKLTGHQGSGNLHSLVLANSLLIVPSGVKSLPAGSILDAWLLE